MSFVGEECFGLNADHFIRIHFLVLEALLYSNIRFDFKEAPYAYLHWNSFLFTPTVHALPCVPIVRDPLCCLQTKHYTLSVFIWCVDSAAQAEWGRKTKRERTVRPTSEKQEFSLSAQSLCRGCCFWKKCTEDSWLLQHNIIRACALVYMKSEVYVNAVRLLQRCVWRIFAAWLTVCYQSLMFGQLGCQLLA